MKAVFKYLGYTVLGLVVLVLGVAGIAIIMDDTDYGPPGLMQTFTVGGKKVHLVRKGDQVSYEASAEGSDIIVNGQKLDLSGGDVFIAEIAPDGKVSVKKQAP